MHACKLLRIKQKAPYRLGTFWSLFLHYAKILWDSDNLIYTLF